MEGKKEIRIIYRLYFSLICQLFVYRNRGGGSRLCNENFGLERVTIPVPGELEEGEGVEERRRVHRERTPAKTRSESFSTPGVGVQPTNLGSFRAKLRGWGEKT